MSNRPPTRALDWLIGALLVAVTWLLYLPTAQHEFIWYDDGMYLLDNGHVNGGLRWPDVGWAFREAHAGNWHPLTWISHALDCELFGLRPGPHHLVAAGLHAINGALCFWVLRSASGMRWASALCAALFALHPLRVQSVAWASERKDLLAGLFFFLCLLAYLRYVRRPSWRAYALVALSLALGLLSKPMLVTLPVLLLLWDLWPLERLKQHSLGHLVREKLPLMALVLASVVLTLIAQDQGGAFQFAAKLPLLERLPHAATSALWYVQSSFWPQGLAIFYPHPGLVDRHWNPWVASLVPLAVGGILVGLAKRYASCCPALPFGLAWMLLMLAPVIGIVQVGEQAWADRYAYLPTIGLYLAIIWPLSKLAQGPRRLPLVCLGVLAVVACAWRTQQELPHWRDSESLARRALAVTSRNHVAHLGLGLARLEAGDAPGAEREFQAARDIYPESTDVVLSYSKLYQAEGRLTEAIELYQDTLRQHPQWLTIRMRLGNVLAQAGRPQEAIPHLEQVHIHNPEHPGVEFNLALAHLANQDPGSALPLLQACLRRTPRFVEARIARGEAHLQLGNYASAKRDLLRGARIQPARAAARLALLLAAAPAPGERDGNEALRWAERAVELDASVQSLEALAAAQAELGRFAKAIATQGLAIERAAPLQRASSRNRLQLYQRSQAYRLPAPP